MNDCDYILDEKDQFHIVRGYWNNEKEILGNKVFSPLIDGERFNKITKKKYGKVIDDNILPKKVYNMKEIFYPRERLKNSYLELKGTLWGDFLDAIVNVGIPIEDMGIIGSYLIGFDISKDVDFVVYGRDNCELLRKNISQVKKFLNATSITKEHIDYQIKKHGSKFSEFNTFDKLLCNKWSSIQMKEGLLSTIRFVYKPDEIPDDPFSNKIIEKDVEISGEIINGFGSNFSPRMFKIKVKYSFYDVATYFWIYQSCALKGMNISVKGDLRENNVITLDNFNHGIKVL